MNTLKVNHLINKNTDLVLDVGEATLNWNGQELNITIIFPEKYSMDNQIWDETGNEILSQPIDFVFKENETIMELSMPLTEINQIDDLLEKDLSISEELEDDATNIYIADTHYSTFNNKLRISKIDNKYSLKLTGFTPDMNYHDFYKSMEQRFAFTLHCNCEIK